MSLNYIRLIMFMMKNYRLSTSVVKGSAFHFEKWKRMDFAFVSEKNELRCLLTAHIFVIKYGSLCLLKAL